ncbi:MAG: hypothetical protein WCE64_03985 [Bacteroidales bacterium]
MPNRGSLSSTIVFCIFPPFTPKSPALLRRSGYAEAPEGDFELTAQRVIPLTIHQEKQEKNRGDGKCENDVNFINNSVMHLLSPLFIFPSVLPIINHMKKTGIIIIIIGLLLTIFTAITFFTREKVVDIGSVAITANKRHNLKWSPLVGVAVMGVGGVVLLLSSKKQ